MIVMKFGGTSVGSAEKIRQVGKIIHASLEKKPVVVCSAMSGVTNKLVEIAEQSFKGESVEENIQHIREKHEGAAKELNVEEKIVEPLLIELQELADRIKEQKTETIESFDHIVSFGERMSVRIVAAYLKTLAVEASAHDAFDIGMITDDTHKAAEPLPESYITIGKNLKEAVNVPVVTGYIGKNKAGKITTLSRGGSDYTASILGAAVGASEIQIWTDVDGVMSSDPRIVDNAKTIVSLSFNEASELATFGAKVLHPKSILPAMDKGIPVRVLNTNNPTGKGTVIVKDGEKKESPIKAIASKKGVSLVNICSTRMLNAHGYLARIFDVFRDHKKSVDMIATSEVSISLTVNEPEGIDEIAKELEGIAKVKLEKNKAIICVVGEGMKEAQGLAGEIFSKAAEDGANISMISQGASEINISFVVDEEQADDIVRTLHDKFV